MSTIISKKIVVDRKKYDYQRMAICFGIAIILNLLIVIYNLANREVVPVTLWEEKIEYRESFVPTIVHLEKNDFKNINCLALNIYHEARGEPLFGKMMVGFVTKNRVESNKFPDTYCEVVYQERKKVAQFSWVNDGLSDTPKNKELWYESQQIAYDIIHKQPKDLAQGALYYHKNDSKTKFSQAHYSRIQPIGTVGKHIMFKHKEG